MIRPTTPSNPSQLSTPPRSTTFPAKSAHKHHIHHHAHRVHAHHHHDKSVPQSATVPTNSNPFGDFLTKTSSRVEVRQDGRPDRSEAPARGLEQQQQGKEGVYEVNGTEKERRERDAEAWKEVERLRLRRSATDQYVDILVTAVQKRQTEYTHYFYYRSDLRTRLSTLSTLSTSTTRRLDYTYYSLLSSTSSLTSAISSLSSLSTQISTLQTHFTSSSSSLASEIATQTTSSSNSFDVQARRIYQLETRIKEGREKVGRLGERLDGVGEKVERSSLREKETRRIVGRRLKMLWGFLAFIAVLVLILATTRYWRRNEYLIRDEIVPSVNRTEWEINNVGGLQGNRQQRMKNQRDSEDLRPGAKMKIGAKETTETRLVRSSAVDADAVLRRFDEL